MPLGVLVEVLLVPHAGTRMTAPQSIVRPSMSQAFLVRVPVAAPSTVNPKIGRASQNPTWLLDRAPVITGPNVLIVSVEVAAGPFSGKLFRPVGYEKEHTGAIVTSGVIEAHASVTPPLPGGLTYPLIGFTVTIPCAPLPAGTLLGDTLVVTVIVNCGVTDSTVSGCVLEAVVVALVPVIVML